MEDEQGAVGQGFGGGSSASPLSDNLPSESLVPNMGSENQVQKSYEEGDGEEIMVEVVGSDVYVDGVGAHKESPSDLREVGDLEGHVAERNEGSETHNLRVAMDVSDEGDGNEVKESDLGLSDLRDNKHFVVTEEVDGSFSKSVDVKGDEVSALPSSGGDVVDDEVRKSGVEAMDGSLSVVSLPNSEVAGSSPMVISEENRTEVEGVTKDSADYGVSEPLDHAEAVFDEKADTKEREEVLPLGDNIASHGNISSQVSGPTEEVPGPSPMVISEEKSEVKGPSPMVVSEEKKTEDEGVSKDRSDLVTPETPSHPGEAVLDDKSDLDEKKQVLLSTDNSPSRGQFSSQVSVPAEEITGPLPAVAEEKTENESVNRDSVDSVILERMNHPGEDALVEKANLADTGVLPATDNSASHHHFSSAVSLPEDVTGLSSVVINEEKRTACEAIHKDNTDLVTPGPSNHNSESVSDGKDGIEEKKEVLLSDDNSAGVPNEEIMGLSPVVISEERETESGGVSKDSYVVTVTPKSLNNPAIAVSDEKAVTEEKEKVLPSTDSSANVDHIDANSVMFHGETKAVQGGILPPEVSLNPNCEGPQNVQVDGIDSHVGEREVIAAESEYSVIKSDTLVRDIQDENQGSLNELNDVNLEPGDQIDGLSHAGPESVHDIFLVSERGEAIGNDESLKNDGDLETRKVRENRVFSNNTNRLPEEGDTATVAIDKCLNAEFQDDKERNELNTTSMTSDNNIEQADSGINSSQPLIATILCAEIDGQDAVISQAEAVDGGGSSEKGREIDPEIPALDSSENMHILEGGAPTKVEIKDVKAIEDDVVCHNPTVNSESFDYVVEMSGSPHITKLEVSVQISESSNHEVENDNLMPKHVASIAAVSDTPEVHQVGISPERTEKAKLLVGGDIMEKPGRDTVLSNDLYKSRQEDREPRESNGFCTADGHTSETKAMDVEEERESDRTYHGGPEVNAKSGSEGPSSDTDKSKSSEEKANYPRSLRMEQSGYLAPPENEGGFVQSDLVWGKVRSHPWWPGQIFDPADASEKALKYHKKDSYLVAYFGDQTFAWNDSSALKPFRSHFSQIEKQSNSESFHNAVSCALEEVERRVELGLACSCISKDAYARIETQVVENTGVSEEASRRHGVDRSTRAIHFEPNKLLEYVTGLAPCAFSRIDRLDLVIARAQLSAFYRFKGYRPPTKFPSPGELLENDADTEQVSDEMAASKKRRHIPKDDSQSVQERSSMELIGDGEYLSDAEDEIVAKDIEKSVSLSSGKKRKAVDHPVEGSDKRVSVHTAKVSTSASQTPKPSFKIGECIRRVASQLTGSTSSVKGSNDETLIKACGNIYEQSEKQVMVVPTESLSVNEMLSQLELLAHDPKKRHNILNNIRVFFLGFRRSIVLNRRGRKKKSEQTKVGSGEEFEFDDVNDSYWTDRIVQNYSEEQTLHDSESGDRNLQLVTFGAEKPVKAGRKSHSRKRFSSGISPYATNEEDENAKRRKQESSPAELILNFAERNCIPSEINLNKMFRRFGPLMESETEVDHESGCAKVIFKRGSDAEVARNSAEKFNIFGPVVVEYQIGYSPVISVKILPVALPQPQEDEAMML